MGLKNIRRGFGIVSGRLRTGTRTALKKGKSEAEYLYEKRKQKDIANEAEEQELGITKGGPRVTIGSTIISPTGQKYLITGSTKKYYITKSGLHIPKSKIDLFDVKQPSTRLTGIISTGKRLYKSV